MYRYNSRNRFNYVMKPNRFRIWLLIAAVAAVVFLIVRLTGGGGLNEGNYENQRNAKIRSEMQHAVSQTNSLSRLGAKSASGGLGKIRQYVHGIEVLNELNVGMYGEVGRLYEQAIFDNIYAIIDTYDAKLASGQKVNDSQALLSEAIDQLSTLTSSKIFSP